MLSVAYSPESLCAASYSATGLKVRGELFFKCFADGYDTLKNLIWLVFVRHIAFNQWSCLKLFSL